jgi:hypothetical protein
MTREQLVRMEAQLTYLSQRVSRAVAATKVAEFDLEEPEFFDWKTVTAWITKLDACAAQPDVRAAKPAPQSDVRAAQPAPQRDDIENDHTAWDGRLGF